VFDNKQIAATSYRVSGYPTTYLIDKSGKVIYASIGFDESMKGVLEELIERNL